MENIQLKHKQHYVFQAYIKKWAVDEQVWCCRNKKIFRANTINVAQVRDFYKMKEINKDEKAFVSLFWERTNQDVKKNMDNYIELYNMPFQWKNHIENLHESIKIFSNLNDIDKNEVNKLLEQVTGIVEATQNNFLEDVYSAGESRLGVFLDELGKGNMAFYTQPYKDNNTEFDNTKREFLYTLSTQYLRTKCMQDKLVSNVKAIIDNKDYDCILFFKGINVKNIRAEHIVHSFFWYLSGQIADMLYDKNAHMTILYNNTNIPFITTDQPIINYSANYGKEQIENENLMFYYPISPQIAITVNDDNAVESLVLRENDVDNYNWKMFEGANEFIFADDKEILEKYLTKI